MRLALLGSVLVLSAGRALACPIAELPLHMVTDGPFDRLATRSVLQFVGRAASLDAARAAARSPELGRELATLSPIEPYISAQAFRLAVRLRQLDCAIIRGAPIDPRLFTNIAAEAGEALHALDASEPLLVRVDGLDASQLVLPLAGLPGARRPIILLPPQLSPGEHLLVAHQRRIGAGVLFGISAIALGGAIALTVVTTRDSQSCNAPDAPFLCNLGAYLDATGTVLLYAATIGAALPAALLLWSATKHERAARAPSLSWSASPASASVSLRFSF